MVGLLKIIVIKRYPKVRYTVLCYAPLNFICEVMYLAMASPICLCHSVI